MMLRAVLTSTASRPDGLGRVSCGGPGSGPACVPVFLGAFCSCLQLVPVALGEGKSI